MTLVLIEVWSQNDIVMPCSFFGSLKVLEVALGFQQLQVGFSDLKFLSYFLGFLG
jgi:hypothetical protein